VAKRHPPGEEQLEIPGPFAIDKKANHWPSGDHWIAVVVVP
jgi:hypothetical protein